MYTFEQLTASFAQYFNKKHFNEHPASLYEPNDYFLSLGGKRIRPVLCLLANELFETISDDAYRVGAAIELFHNFTLVHDDIMDQAPLRRGMQTVHEKYSTSTAILSGDVMLIKAYQYINEISSDYKKQILELFSATAVEVCEGQQLDMDYEKIAEVSMQDYLHMIKLKTSVLLAASLKMGGILGGGSLGNLNLLYEAGINMGLAFQIQDDYLDAFGDPLKFGKQIGGDILANKKTFLLIHALEVATAQQKEKINQLLASNHENKIAEMLSLYKECGVDAWALALKEQYLNACLKNIDDIAVVSKRKEPLIQLSNFLINREK
ncbi:MAG: polyprenyl synthetase family protein [Chitinophagaceae bacterium]|nr:MAG: polyprenyl synthetase family protein [Chitinophagaceae bacterium]